MIDLPEIAAGAALLSLIAYALLGGADFGGGVWDLLASGPRAGLQRETIANAIGPIWEANHVWLIGTVVLLLGAFPAAFAEISTRLHVPLTGMLIGIVLRGSSFIFRAYDRPASRVQRRWGRIFAVSSTLTPVLLGVVIGAITLPPAPLAADATPWDVFVRPWLQPLPFAVGLFALAQFAFLAAVYLTVEAQAAELREDFRRRALGAAAAVAALALGVLALAGGAAPSVARALLASPWSLPLLLATAAAAAAAVALLWLRRYVAASICAAAQVAAILLGWGLAMNPYLIAGSLTIREAAAPRDVLVLLLAVLAGGGAILLPALVYLLRTFKGPLISGR